MTYKELIETISVIIENEKIYKKGLMLTYTLDDKTHKQMNGELFYKANPPSSIFVPNDEFEIELGGIVVKFIKEISVSNL